MKKYGSILAVLFCFLFLASCFGPQWNQDDYQMFQHSGNLTMGVRREEEEDPERGLGYRLYFDLYQNGRMKKSYSRFVNTCEELPFVREWEEGTAKLELADDGAAVLTQTLSLFLNTDTGEFRMQRDYQGMEPFREECVSTTGNLRVVLYDYYDLYRIVLSDYVLQNNQTGQDFYLGSISHDGLGYRYFFTGQDVLVAYNPIRCLLRKEKENWSARPLGETNYDDWYVVDVCWENGRYYVAQFPKPEGTPAEWPPRTPEDWVPDPVMIYIYNEEEKLVEVVETGVRVKWPTKFFREEIQMIDGRPKLVYVQPE